MAFGLAACKAAWLRSYWLFSGRFLHKEEQRALSLLGVSAPSAPAHLPALGGPGGTLLAPSESCHPTGH